MASLGITVLAFVTVLAAVTSFVSGYYVNYMMADSSTVTNQGAQLQVLQEQILGSGSNSSSTSANTATITGSVPDFTLIPNNMLGPFTGLVNGAATLGGVATLMAGITGADTMGTWVSLCAFFSAGLLVFWAWEIAQFIRGVVWGPGA